MTELERTGAKSEAEEPTVLPSGHLAPVRLRGRPTSDTTGWSPTAWHKQSRKDEK